MRSRSWFKFPYVSTAFAGSLLCTASVFALAVASDTQAAQSSSTEQAAQDANTELAATEVAANALLAADVPRLVEIVRRDRESRAPGTPPSPEAQAAMTQLSQTIRAEAVSPTFRAMALMALGEFDKACQLLFESGAAIEDLEPEGLLLLARCRDASGDFDGAIEAYERLEEEAPGEYIIPLELGSAYQRAGRTSDARRAYQRALTNNPPPIIGQNLAAIVSQLKASQLWRVDVETGFLHDTNINTGLSGGTISVGGIDFDVVGGDEEAGTGFYAEATGSALFPQDETVSILVQGFASTDRYLSDDDDEFDDLVLLASFGPVFQFDQTTVTVGPLGSVSLIDDEAELWQVGVQSRVSHQITERINAFGQGVYLAREVESSDAQDSDRFSLLLGGEYQITSGISVAVGGEVVYEDAVRGDFTHFDITPLVSWNGQITNELSVFGSFRFTDADYSDEDPTLGIERNDEVYRVDANVAFDLSRWVYEGLELRGQYEYTERDSNNPLFDFDRHVVRVGVGITF